MKDIFNNIPICITHTITREDRNAENFKDIKRLIEYLFDKINEEIQEASIESNTLAHTGFHELYIQKPRIHLNNRDILLGCFECNKDLEKPIELDTLGFYFIDMNERSEFPNRGWIEFGRHTDYDTCRRLIDRAVDIFRTFLYIGVIKNHFVSIDDLE